MRAWVLVCASCSFEPGVLPRPGTAPDDAMPIVADGTDPLTDAATDASMAGGADAPPACPGFTTVAGAPANSRYRIHGYSMNPTADQSRYWNQAKADCMTEGGYLAIIDTQAELTALDAAIPQNPAGPSNIFHVGITDAAVEGTWLTVFGQTSPYLTWASGQPSGATTQNCGAAGDTALWDIVCGTSESDHKLAFACECNVP